MSACSDSPEPVKSLAGVASQATDRPRALTLPGDDGQIAFLDALGGEALPSRHPTALIGYLLAVVPESSLAHGSLRSCRILVPLQQATKLLTSISTRGGQTTVLKEPAANLAV
jgi:hypothetical protein